MIDNDDVDASNTLLSVQTSLTFENGVKKLIPRLCQTGDF